MIHMNVIVCFWPKTNLARNTWESQVGTMTIVDFFCEMLYTVWHR